MRRFYLILALFTIVLPLVYGHAGVTPVPVGALHATGNQIADSTGQTLLLRGVEISGLNVADPDSHQDASRNIAAMNDITFTTIRQTWNMNAVRLPVASRIWQRDGQDYLDRVARIVKLANNAGLVVVIAEFDDASAGSSNGTGLPGPDVMAFWTAWAAYFKDNPMMIFDVFHAPSASAIPGHVGGKHLPSDWQFWLYGGTATTGQQVVGMQDLVNAIRAAGAPQLIAISALDDGLDFRGLLPQNYVRDSNVIYEVRPYYDHDFTDQDRDANFGFLAEKVPVYAGEWGVNFGQAQPNCLRLRGDIQAATTVLLQTLAYFYAHSISWTAEAFEPSVLIQDFTTYAPTALDRAWNCGSVLNPQPGIGQLLLLWQTGDPLGFGTVEAVSNAAGGPYAPTMAVAPGEIILLYRQQVSPDNAIFTQPDDSGRLPITLADTQVFFDDIPAPILAGSTFGLQVQVPYEVAGKSATVLQVVYRGMIRSNRVTLPVIEAAPEIFRRDFGTTADATNEDGTPNWSGNPASVGSVLSLLITGAGQMAPPGISGKVAQEPCGQPALPVTISVNGIDAEILSAAEAPGKAGMVKVDVRLPGVASTGGSRVVVRVGAQSSQATNVLIWMR